MKHNKKNKTYVRVSRIKDTSSSVDWDKPLNLETILELSKKGLLKEKKITSKKAA